MKSSTADGGSVDNVPAVSQVECCPWEPPTRGVLPEPSQAESGESSQAGRRGTMLVAPNNRPTDGHGGPLYPHKSIGRR